MTVFVSSDVVLDVSGANGNNPLIGYENRMTAANTVSTTEGGDNPVTNVLNPSTISIWKGTSTVADEYITVTLNSVDDIDYVAIANHNFGSGLITLSVETQETSVASWVEVSSEVLVTQNGPVLFRFDPQAVYAVRLKMQPSAAAVPVVPQAAVVYVGKLLIVQRRLYVGHTPIPLGRTLRVANGRSEKGHFLGRVVLNEKLMSAASFKNLTPSWYRDKFDPFVVAAQTAPFFFSWRPQDYPLETGFAWLSEDPQPTNQLANGMMQVDLQMTGVSL